MLVITTIGLMAVIIDSRLPLGRDGGSIENAPPALRTASMATGAHLDFSKHTGTIVVGPRNGAQLE